MNYAKVSYPEKLSATENFIYANQIQLYALYAKYT